MKIWFNGEIRNEQGVIGARDRGFLLGDGVFETLSVINGEPLFLSRHVGRLKASLIALGFATSLDERSLGNAIAALAEINDLKIGNAVARITVTRGTSERGLDFLSVQGQEASI